jgi:selenocysteine lyase/cysteine desulfurase
MNGVRVRDRGSRQCGIVSFTAEDVLPVDIVRGLAERGINSSESQATSTQLDMHGRGLESLVRAGIHYYNTEEEMERFVAALEEIIRR